MTRLMRWLPAIVLVLSFAPLTHAADGVTTDGGFGNHQHKQHRCANNRPGDLLFDDFHGPNLNPIWQPSLPNAPYRFRSVPATFLGASTFAFQSLGGNSVIRLHNILDNTQRRGWSAATGFRPNGRVVYEARFNTLVQSETTGIDELLELWLLNASDPGQYDFVALSTPGFGARRLFTAGSSVTGQGLDSEDDGVSFSFEQNTWYRLVITGSDTEDVRASLFDDARTTELIGVSFGHTLTAYPAGFKVGISQSMGFPDVPAPTDVAVDWVRLSGSAAHPTVFVGECDSQVPNPVLPSGCTVSDLFDECSDNDGHQDHDRHQPGRFVRCVARLSNDLKEDGVITNRQSRAIKDCAIKREAPLGVPKTL